VKVLLYSPVFLPHVGGLELNIAHLAEEITAAGHEVVVVTKTPDDQPNRTSYAILRQPGALALLRHVAWCDVFFQANVSLRGLWPLVLVRRPWVVSHHGWYSRPDGARAWQDSLKRWLRRFAAASISVSRAVAADLATPSTVIANSYRDKLFRRIPGVDRSGELLFVGRLDDIGGQGSWVRIGHPVSSRGGPLGFIPRTRADDAGARRAPASRRWRGGRGRIGWPRRAGRQRRTTNASRSTRGCPAVPDTTILILWVPGVDHANW